MGEKNKIRNIEKISKVKMEFFVGTDIKSAITDAWHYHCEHGCTVIFDFNGSRIQIKETVEGI